MNPVFKFLWFLLFVTAAGLAVWACGDDDTDAPPPSQDDVQDESPERFLDHGSAEESVYGEVFVYEFNHRGQDYRCFVVFDTGFECEEIAG